MNSRIRSLLAIAALAPLLLAPTCGPAPTPDPVDRNRVELPGLNARARVSTDEFGVPHVVAQDMEDAWRTMGYLHARDRFFQMDLRRRQSQGRSAELLGTWAALYQDIVVRWLGLRGAAERSEALLEPRTRELVQAYTDGVNAWLDTNPLPSEYSALELTSAPPWQTIDTLMISSGSSASLGIWMNEPGRTTALDAYRTALGYEAGTALWSEDAVRVAPAVPVATVPDAGGSIPFGAPSTQAASAQGAPTGEPEPNAVAAVAGRARQGFPGTTWPLSGEPEDRVSDAGSNFWGVAGWASETGVPLIAGDQHLALSAPAGNYEIHLTIEDDPHVGRLNVSGCSSPGLINIVTGQTDHIAWGVTNFTSDIGDHFDDRLVRGDPGCPVDLCIDSEGELHPVELRQERYYLNLLNNDVLDDLADVTSIVEQNWNLPSYVNVMTVPFRGWGPITNVEDWSVVDGTNPTETETRVDTLQLTVLLGGRDLDGRLGMVTARTVAEFGAATRLLTATTKHWIVGDTAGGLAYFSSGEVPLRADLEAGTVHGDIPDFVRDGSGPANWIPDPGLSQGQVLPFKIIPYDEMPHVIDPPNGFIVNANNDPSGVQLDNDMTSHDRPSSPGSIYYVGIQFPRGYRAGRITNMLREKLDAGEKISPEDMKRIQSDNRPLHAELTVPFLLTAWENATAPGAPAVFAPLVSDPELAEAIGRLRDWDYSTPTGIPEGYDASDVDGVRDPVVSPEEAASSVAASIYAVWSAETLQRTLFDALTALGLRQFPNSNFAGLLHLLQQDPFTGVGVSGVDFFPEPATESAEVRRDVTLLQALRTSLDLLASDVYAPAFAYSTDQDDYHWGLLHRVRVVHAFDDASTVPTAAGFEDYSPELPGMPRDGADNAVNTGWPVKPVGAQGAHAFESTAGAVARVIYSVGDSQARPDGVLGYSNLAGGASGDPNDPTYMSQLASWLTVDHHRVPMNSRDVRDVAEKVEFFEPAP